MMKRRFIKLLMGAAAALTALIATSCEEEMPYIILDQEAVIVGTDAEKVTIDVKSNVTWTATTQSDWCQVFGESGNYKGYFEILVDENTSISSRVATVTVSGDGIQANLLITQSGGSLALSIPVPEYSVNNEEQPLDIKYLVTSDEVDVDAISEAMWAEVVSVKDGTCKMQIAENKTGKDRESKITFVTSYGNKPAILGSTLIKQSAKGVLLMIPVEEYAVNNEAQDIKLAYTITDEDATVDGSSNCNWITVSRISDGIANVSVLENETGEARTGIVTLVTVTTAGEAVTASTTINQAATENILDVVVDSVSFAPAGETITVPVVSNATVSASCTSDWVSASVKDNTITFVAVANNTKIARTAYATVTIASGKGETLSKKIILTQGVMVDDELTLPVPSVNIIAEGATVKVPYTANTDVTVKTSADWCTAEIKGSDIVVTATANDGDYVRKAYVTVTTKNGTSGVVTVTQAVVDGDTLELLVSEVNFTGSKSSMSIPYKASTAVTVKTSAKWATATVGTNSDIEVSVEPNNTGADRVCYITLTTEDGTAGVITATQTPVDAKIEFSPESVELGYAESESFISMNCSGSWVMDNTDDQIPNWLTISPTKGEGNSVITVKAKANKFAHSRTTQISFTNTTNDISGVLTITQNENPNGITDYSYLGKGYNVAGTYAEETDVKARVLDGDLLADGNHIADLLSFNSTEEEIITGHDINEYQTNYSASAKVSGSYSGFSASVSANFSSKAQGSSDYRFATLRHMTKKSGLKIFENETASDLMDCRADAFIADIDKLSASSLVDKYGTHVITGFSLGGVLEYSMAADAVEVGEEINWGVAVSAGFQQEGVGNASAEAETTGYNSVKNASSSYESRLKCRGGQSQYASSATIGGDGSTATGYKSDTYSQWLSSLEQGTNLVLVDYEGSCLIPISEFIDNSTKKAAVAAEITKRLTGVGIVPTSNYKTLTVQLDSVKTNMEDSAGDNECGFTLTENYDNATTATTIAKYENSTGKQLILAKNVAKYVGKTGSAYLANKTKSHTYVLDCSNIKEYDDIDDDKFAGYTIKMTYDTTSDSWSYVYTYPEGRNTVYTGIKDGSTFVVETTNNNQEDEHMWFTFSVSWK